MIQSCIILLLVAACSVYANVALNGSQNEMASAYLDIAIDMISKAKSKIPKCDDCTKIDQKVLKKPLDCADILEMGHNKSGVYEIWPVSRMTEGKSLHVFCDMETNGGGWTVIQRRGDFQTPKDYFYRDWKSYKEGFGKIEKDFWLGNDNIFALTNQKRYSVRFDLKDFEGNKRHALYDNFWIADENHNYTLQISNYSGDAGDSMSYHNNQPFSTKDRHNSISDCAEKYKGAWWYNLCHLVNLNGLYQKEKAEKQDGISWKTWKGNSESLAWTEMKVRPKNFRLSLS